MTDLEISKALALAIGWKRVMPNDSAREVLQCWVYTGYYWRPFDYKDWNVIGPIAAKLIVELIKCKSNQVAYWQAIRGMEDDLDHCIANGDTPQKAIAMAVIGAKK